MLITISWALGALALGLVCGYVQGQRVAARYPRTVHHLALNPYDSAEQELAAAFKQACALRATTLIARGEELRRQIGSYAVEVGNQQDQRDGISRTPHVGMATPDLRAQDLALSGTENGSCALLVEVRHRAGGLELRDELRIRCDLVGYSVTPAG
jgi:hypothetical protein